MIEVRNLVKRYGDEPALDGLSFTVEDGQIYGFLGPNGAGKSTTMNIITGYISATSGEVVINGHSIADEPREAKRCIGYLPEVPPLYTDMTVEEYLRFAAELKKLPKKERQAAVEQVIEIAGLDEVRHRLIANLSKGFRQRVGIAQAVMGMPEIIILDEPTAGLDPKQIIEIRDLIRSLAADHTVILSSHILSEIQELCDKIIIIHQGRLIANGTPAQLEEQLGERSMEITLKTDDAEAAAALAEGIEGVESVKLLDSPEGETTLHLNLSRTADVREAVFDACVASNMPLLMMKSTDFSLEHAFLELTRERRLVRRRKRRRAKEQPDETETVTNEETAPAKEAAAAEETVPAKEAAAAEETVPAEEAVPDEETETESLTEAVPEETVTETVTEVFPEQPENADTESKEAEE